MSSAKTSPVMSKEKRLAHKVRNYWHKLSRKTRWTILAVILILIAIRIALPYVIKTYVNRQLNRSKDFAGHVGDIDVALIRGAYEIRDLKIMKKTGGVPVPFFSVENADLSIQWGELFHGAVAGEIYLEKPALNFVAATNATQAQTGENQDWGSILKNLFPFKFNHFEANHGQIHFRNFQSTPPVDIYLNDLSVVATNLTNTRNLKQNLPAGVHARATALNGGLLDFHLRLNPLANPPAFELNAQLTNVDLTSLNDFLKAYGKFDVEKGRFALFTSVAAVDGRYDGYLKIFFDQLDVFSWEKERKKNILKIFWEAVVGAATTLFKNQPEDRLATRIPISGSYTGTSVGVWTAVGNLLHNAFIRALLPKLDESVKLQQVTGEGEKNGKTETNAPPTAP